MSARPKRRARRGRTHKRELATEHRLRCGYWFVATLNRCDFYDPDGTLLRRMRVHSDDPWYDIVTDA